MTAVGAFAREMLALTVRALAPLSPPPVRALHLPPEFTRGSKDGEFCALELEDGSIGLSYALLGDTAEALVPGRAPARLAGMPSLELAARFGDARALPRALGLAAINALSQHLFRRAGYAPDTASDSIGLLDPRPGERVGMVGLFPPLTRRILAAGASLVVVELDPALAGQRDGYTVTLDHRELARCDKVLSTTTLMLNDTVDEVIAACANARALVLVGPGGGCLPDALFARGVSALGGTAIVDRDGFVDALARGQAWGRHARKYVIARAGYPGADALVARARA
jgi:uncharacterized protein (DUF4213/DUF364 family)